MEGFLRLTGKKFCIMIKFLLICVLIGYVLYKLSSSITVHTHTGTNRRPSQRPPGGNVNIDSTPGAEKKSDGRNFKGGEYVDFEDVK